MATAKYSDQLTLAAFNALAQSGNVEKTTDQTTTSSATSFSLSLNSAIWKNHMFVLVRFSPVVSPTSQIYHVRLNDTASLAQHRALRATSTSVASDLLASTCGYPITLLFSTCRGGKKLEGLAFSDTLYSCGSVSNVGSPYHIHLGETSDGVTFLPGTKLEVWGIL